MGRKRTVALKLLKLSTKSVLTRKCLKSGVNRPNCDSSQGFTTQSRPPRNPLGILLAPTAPKTSHFKKDHEKHLRIFVDSKHSVRISQGMLEMRQECPGHIGACHHPLHKRPSGLVKWLPHTAPARASRPTGCNTTPSTHGHQSD